MTIPTRPAPPPPNRSHVSHHNATSSSSSTISSINRFPSKKPAPPRPPPPKVTEAPLKKSSSQKSISIFSNIFGVKSNNKQTIAPTIPVNTTTAVVPPKLPAPPKAHPHIQPRIQSDVQLINFDASPPPSPPPSIKKSNTGSDSVSMDSFCSSTSSPNNLGATSQAESGFEDDFSVSDFKVTSGMTTRSTTFSDPFDCIDDFSPLPPAAAPSNIRNVKPLIQPKPTGLQSVPSSVFDTLSNGKNLIKPSTVSMPTIIKPAASAGRGKISPINLETKKTEKVLMQQSSDESFDDDLPSPPMPTIPPPPPPSSFEEDDEEKCSHAIALFDFESDVPEDLNIKANEKVYLIKQMNEEWMYGRNKRGCEGIFPISFVEVRVPLQVDPDSGTASRSASVSPAVESHRVRALYNFNAETDEDLTIQENEIVNVIYEINPEWLYGSNERGDYGQFPSNFIEFVPHNLPQMPK